MKFLSSRIYITIKGFLEFGEICAQKMRPEVSVGCPDLWAKAHLKWVWAKWKICSVVQLINL